MKYILQGIGDYCKDCWHDFWFCFWNYADNFVSRRLHHTYCWKENEALYTKEGSIYHYIMQRKISRKKSNAKKESTRK